MKRCVLWTRWETNEMMYDGVYLRIIMKQYILTLRYYLTKRIYSGFLLGEFRLFSILMFTRERSNQNLRKDEIVEVIGDSPKMEYIFPNVAPWVKVRLIDGTSGFVFGAFLRKEEEPDIELINEKAKKWLILNKD